MYAFGTKAWTEVKDYPYGCGYDKEKRISDYEMIYIPEASSYFVIGGTCGYDPAIGEVQIFSRVARFGVSGSPPFARGTWYDAGHLNKERQVSFRSLLFVPKKLIKL